jgi:SnoaL-like polyketide cyclase
MSGVTSSEAAKAIVRGNTEEVQGRGNFDVFENSSPTISSIRHRSPARLPIKRVCENSTPIFVPHSLTFVRRSTGNLPMADRVTTYKTYHGTHEGPFLGVAPTHRKIHFETVDVMRVQNGRITDHWGVGNLLSLMQQSGGWIPPG